MSDTLPRGASSTILLVEDSADDRYLRRVQIELAGHRSHAEPDLAGALAALAENPDVFDLALLDLGLPDVREPLEAVRALASTDVPVVVLMNRHDAALAVSALEAGAVRYLVKQRLDRALLAETVAAVARNARALRRSDPTSDGAEGMEGDVVDAVASLASHSGVDDWTVSMGSITHGTPLSAELRELFGDADQAAVHATLRFAAWTVADLGLCGRIEGEALGVAGLPPSPVPELDALVVEPIGSPAIGILVGAVLGRDAPLGVELVQRTVRTLERGLVREQRRIDAVARADAAVSAAQLDPMTGLLNRRALERVLAREQLRALRSGDEDVLVVVDLDELKEVNDRWGHAAGDDLIRRAAASLEAAVRGSDMAFRTGGDEFVVLAPLCDEFGGPELVDRIRSSFDRAGIAASLGYSARGSDGQLTDALERADAAMYAEKERKRH